MAEQRPAAAGTAGTGRDEARGPAESSATPKKWQRVLQWFVDGGTLNRFEAYRELRDSCLNTTVSQIERRGVKILRREETIQGVFGAVHCCRYWISPDALQRARELLGLPTVTSATCDGQNALERAA